MPGLYIHIPFCKSKCSYCDFCSVANQSLHKDFITALIAEIEHRSQYYCNTVFNSVYFGGGTPSLLNPRYIENIINSLHLHYKIGQKPEITLEANPDDLNLEYLKSIKRLNINRLSVGIQSLNNDILKFMRRRHDSDFAIKSVIAAADLGFNNISADIIYGIDGFSSHNLSQELEKMLSLPINHLSAYHLGIEPGTLLFKQLQNGKIQKIREEESLEQYSTVIETALKYGFQQYEISNFAKDGQISRHNSAYWDRSVYAGFGPSAHSFDGKIRSYNTGNVKEYIINGLSQNFNPEKETLDLKDEINETIMLGLRQNKGIYLTDYLKKFGLSEYSILLSKVKTLNKKFYSQSDEYLSLSRDGMFISDTVCTKLFQ